MGGDIIRTTGEILLQKRKEKNMRQTELSNLLGIDQSTYSCYECGRRKLSVEMAKQIANIFDTDWAQFFETENTS